MKSLKLFILPILLAWFSKSYAGNITVEVYLAQTGNNITLNFYPDLQLYLINSNHPSSYINLADSLSDGGYYPLATQNYHIGTITLRDEETYSLSFNPGRYFNVTSHGNVGSAGFGVYFADSARNTYPIGEVYAVYSPSAAINPSGDLSIYTGSGYTFTSYDFCPNTSTASGPYKLYIDFGLETYYYRNVF